MIRALEGAERERALEELARQVAVHPDYYAPERAVLFEVREARGAVLCRYLLAELEGAEARVLAAAALANRCDLVARVLPVIERQVQGARAISMGTHRRGLVRKLERRGYAQRPAPRGRFELVKELRP